MLRKAVYFNATLQELKQAGESTQDAAELVGGGYLANLGVYHELHCVVMSTASHESSSVSDEFTATTTLFIFIKIDTTQILQRQI